MADQPSDTFDPFNQVVTVLAPDGTTPIPIPLAFIQQVQSNTIAMGIVQGTQLGAAALLLVCLFLITKKDKLRSLLFILNAVALFLVVIRGIVSGIGFTGPFFDWYRFSTQYYANTDHAKAVSVAADLLTLLLTIVIEMSVLLQVRIVCCTLEPIWRHAVNVSNTLMAAVVIGMRLAVSTLTIKWNILGVQHETEWQFEHLTKFAKASNIAFIVSIGISVTVFCGKLAFAIHRRRSMGMKQFGSMQVVLIMGCQTMILPCKSPCPHLRRVRLTMP